VAKLWSLKAERSGNVIATNRDSAGIVFVARGRHLARIERGIKRLTFFDVKSGAELKTMEAAEVASSPDGTVLVAVHGSELIFLDQDSLAEIARMECGKVLGGKPSISPDNNWLALRGGDQTGDLAETDVLIVDIRNRKIERLLDTDDERWAPVFFALNGKLLITMQWPTQRAVVWDTTTWKLRRTLYEPRDRQATGPIADVSADGMNLACIGEDNSLQIWNLERLDEPVRINSGIGDVMSIAFDYDGKTVALGAISGAIHIWNLQAGQEILVLTGNRSYAGSLAFSPDGTGLASAGFDRTLRMWRAPSWEQINR
jgi:WD40 repeat protein